MFQRGLVKCSSLFFIVFLMCPRRVRPTAVSNQEYYHAVKKLNNDIDVPDVKLRSGAPGWLNIGGSDSDDYIIGEEDEAGFDLSDDEIRKLKLWPKGIIPYYIDAISFSDKVIRDRMRMFLNAVNQHTRLSFLELPAPPKDDNTRWVFFANRRGQLGCGDHSTINMTNEGVQHVVLGYDCLVTQKELAEAVLSIVGIANQHNAPDRDKYIMVVEENIMPDKKYLFTKLSDKEWLFHNIEYDLYSAGHFHHHKYSQNGQATIEYRRDPLSSNKLRPMGGGHGFSTTDIQKMKMLYNYIVGKKENKVPECDKLFRKGENYKPVSLPEIKPRKKPDAYLGTQTTKTTTPLDFHNNYFDGTFENEHVTNIEPKPEEDIKMEEYAGENYDENQKMEKMDLKSHPMNVKLKSYKVDPLLYLSDYQTGDEYRRKGKAQENKTKKAKTTA